VQLNLASVVGKVSLEFAGCERIERDQWCGKKYELCIAILAQVLSFHNGLAAKADLKLFLFKKSLNGS